MSVDVVIGVDAGGTSTRCAVVALDGRVLGRGRAGGANQYSSSDPGEAFRAALGEALAEAGDVAVVRAVFGVAGAAASGHARAVATVRGAWSGLGLPGDPVVNDDIAVAFAAGSPEPAGLVLIAGTGAVAARVCDGEVLRRCDGYGWLLGDEGSAVWIGLAGLRAALAAIDGRGPATVLRDRLAHALGVPPGDPQAVIRAVHDRPPAELGRLAPEVMHAARAGDAAAAGIAEDAARRLLTNLASVAPATRPAGQAAEPAAEPVVLAGAVLAGGPVADAVRAGVRRRFGATPVSATDGALGAAGLALRQAGVPAAVHAALLTRAASAVTAADGPDPTRPADPAGAP
ncbi:BadF/BadG/BcrA/BcrD ATPase family protein [Marinitenerispora sediminis]|uniref:N-acetylglucosamine kinase n=1 Tax=Marinitenerispora sediminis TaxID=1931232 RepID=A0A368TC40_9ACTN|nr:BadF/BadG/BcrA/BcrD ATPase family protein [Marinitenerispora sediminis]RCV51693.1 N-acetylglucosamine kinase [Marinitenerispora sediminis]RCV58140.1 N-acetylglucosamine kinase [Marinitenerispora sediminis]RCV62511.1 N-acetylglucosamine kinase [Marinitenerispora sediminis]